MASRAFRLSAVSTLVLALAVGTTGASPTRDHGGPGTAAPSGVTAAAPGASGVVPARTTRAMPGHFTGYAFDQCQAPSQAAMDAWWEHSPYAGIGIYVAGDNRYCKDQVHLDAAWVATQAARGWRLLPLTVGPQASCSTVERYADRRISGDPAGGYAKARAQGRTEATTTVDAVRTLGIGARSILWYDLEAFPTTAARCRDSALAFLEAWTLRVRELGFRSGVYSSAASGIAVLDRARLAGTHEMPDALWVAEWMDPAAYRIPPRPSAPSAASAFYDGGWWAARGRLMRQYRGDHRETHGGVEIDIDTNHLWIGRGSVAPPAAKPCRTLIDHRRYRPLRTGVRHEQVRAAHCLLRAQGHYRGRLRPAYTARTEAAVRRLQASAGLPVSGRIGARTWTVLLAAGPVRVAKVGSAGHAVRRLQRALNAAARADLPVTGVYDYATTVAVRSYQRTQRLPRTGVASTPTWLALLAGRP